MNVTIPSNAVPGQYALSAQVPSANAYASAFVTIADPRLPSGVLNVTCLQTVFRPASNNISLLLATSTYLGTVVRNSTVDISWMASAHGSTPPAPVYSGTDTTVLASGKGTYMLTLPADTVDAMQKSKATYSLAVVVTWLDAGM